MHVINVCVYVYVNVYLHGCLGRCTHMHVYIWDPRGHVMFLLHNCEDNNSEMCPMRKWGKGLFIYPVLRWYSDGEPPLASTIYAAREGWEVLGSSEKHII